MCSQARFIKTEIGQFELMFRNVELMTLSNLFDAPHFFRDAFSDSPQIDALALRRKKCKKLLAPSIKDISIPY
jgi:hypothetical protein